MGSVYGGVFVGHLTQIMSNVVDVICFDVSPWD